MPIRHDLSGPRTLEGETHGFVPCPVGLTPCFPVMSCIQFHEGPGDAHPFLQVSTGGLPEIAFQGFKSAGGADPVVGWAKKLNRVCSANALGNRGLIRLLADPAGRPRLRAEMHSSFSRPNIDPSSLLSARFFGVRNAPVHENSRTPPLIRIADLGRRVMGGEDSQGFTQAAAWKAVSGPSAR